MKKCPFCGKDITEGIGQCPHCQKDLTTVNAIRSAVDGAVAPLSTKVTELGTKVAEVGTKVTEIEGRMARIEALPAVQSRGAPAILTFPNKYKGYRLGRMLGFARETASKNPHHFEMFKSEEHIDNYCKFVIDTIRALKFQDAESKQALHDMYDQMPETKASLAEGADATGGYLVPVEYQWDIIALARSRAYFLQIAKVYEMSALQMKVPTEASLATIYWKGEASQMTQGDPTFSQVDLTAKKATALAVASNEMIADSAIDIASLLTEQFAYGIAIDIDNQALNGTGDPVSGLLVGSIVSQAVTMSGASMSTVTATNLSEMIYNLSESDLPNARFMIARLLLHYIRSLKDSNNNPIFAMPGATVPGRIYEFPYVMSEKISNTDGASKTCGLFGDFQKYIIGRRKGDMTLDIDPYGRFDYDQTRFRMVTRWAFALGRGSAFCKIKTSA